MPIIISKYEWRSEALPVPNGYSFLKSVLIPENIIQRRISKLSFEIMSAYSGKDPYFLTVKDGAQSFANELRTGMMDLYTWGEIRVKSRDCHGNSTTLDWIQDVPDNVIGRDVVIIEDIVDSGMTLDRLIKRIQDKKSTSVSVAVLIWKHIKREYEDLEKYIKFIGFKIPDEYVIGYGLDYNEKYRDLPFVGIMKN